IGPVTDAERATVIAASPLAGKYEQEIDRESAYEVLMGRATGGQLPSEEPPATPGTGQRRRGQYDASPPIQPAPAPSGPWGRAPAPAENKPKPEPRLREAQPVPVPSSPVPRTPAGRSDTITTTIVKSAARTATNIAVREASKAIFGSGRNSGILGQIFRGALGGIMK
ncbi:MAG TPA: helicase HerA-like domain-containing protein, partial [Reyranella sp.]|nr:helicase HerA-like domain-containing protein [Reyranella sp.]